VKSDLTDIVVGVATVALITIGTRWLTTAKGAQKPVSCNGVNVYSIKWQIRTASYVAALFALLLSIEGFLHDARSGRWTLDLFLVIFAVVCIWFGSGKVLTDQNGITKKSPWKAQVLRWDEISRVQVHKRDAGAIELCAGSRKLIVDSRFVAAPYLLSEIEAHTNMPVGQD
jgi:hypothetical protein